jgi:tRNA A37 N6-isopentenylltransferase MiaA
MLGVNKMFKYLKRLVKGPTDLEAANTELNEAYLELLTELNEAYLELLSAQTGVEYTQSIVNFNKARIARLEAYLEFVEESK